MRRNVSQRTSGGQDRESRARSRYRDNLARHLIGISRDLQTRIARALGEECGYRGLRPSFGPFLSLIWEEGRPLRDIAEPLAISKQACSQLANLAEEAGYLERKPHPADRRSKVVSLTASGRGLVEQGVRIILEIEAEYAGLVGPGAYRQLVTALAALHQGFGLPTHSDPALSARARRSAGVLPLIAVRIQRDLMESTIARGHPGLKMSHGQVLPLIGAEGGRISEIARVQHVTRQAISTISQDLETLGYLRREADPRDGRSVVLRLTPRGEGLIADSVVALDGLELAFLEILGARPLESLQRVARDLYHALGLEAEIFEAELEGRSSDHARDHAMDEAEDDVTDERNGTSRAGYDIRRLASRLRERLDPGEARTLATLLESRKRRAAT